MHGDRWYDGRIVNDANAGNEIQLMGAPAIVYRPMESTNYKNEKEKKNVSVWMRSGENKVNFGIECFGSDSDKINAEFYWNSSKRFNVCLLHKNFQAVAIVPKYAMAWTMNACFL